MLLQGRRLTASSTTFFLIAVVIMSAFLFVTRALLHSPKHHHHSAQFYAATAWKNKFSAVGRCSSIPRQRQRQSWMSSSSSSSVILNNGCYDDDDDDDNEDDAILEEDAKDFEYDDLPSKITKLNGGMPINVQSPKQVSLAIFGKSQPATKLVLQKAASSDSDLSPEKQQLARYILESRKQLQEARKRMANADDTAAAATTTIRSNNGVERQPPTTTLKPEKPTTTMATTTLTNKSNSRRKIMSSSKAQSTHEQMVHQLFKSSTTTPKSQIDPFWKEPLLALSRPSARALVSQLDPTHCPMGYNPNNGSAPAKKGTFLAYCRAQKELYPQCVILVRCGDFYETYGLDAVLLVEHVGLNPMAGKPKAGCPYRNIQATVDGLTRQGFSVAVYEEVGTAASGRGSSSTSSTTSKLKTRLLAQIVSPASPTYLYDTSWLLGGEEQQYILDGLPPSRPCVGIVHTSAGYHLVEVSMEEQSVTYSERLTPEALACRLMAYPPADPVVYIPSAVEEQQKDSAVVLPFLKNGRNTCGGEYTESTFGGYRLRTKVLPPHLIPAPRPGISDADRYVEVVVNTFLRLNEQQRPKHPNDGGDSDIGETQGPTVDDFTISMKTTKSYTNPLYVETATQLGLLNDPHIPSLTSHILEDAAPAVTRRFLHRFLMVPPPPAVANAMATVVTFLLENDAYTLPPLTVPPLGKVLSLIRAGQASAAIYGELLQSLSTTRHVLQQQSSDNIYEDDNGGGGGGGDDDNQELVDALLVLCGHESGLAVTKASLLERSRDAMLAIEAVISPSYHADVSETIDDGHHHIIDVVTKDRYIPAAYLERNEQPWRGRVRPEVAEIAYLRVAAAAEELSQAVMEDFIIDEDSKNQALIVQDIFNNIFAMKQIPSGHSYDKDYYFHPRDRHGKLLRNRYTSAKVQEALGNYVNACDTAREQVSTALSQLAETLQESGHIPAIAQSAHLNLVLSAAFHHALKANQKNWNMATVIESHDETTSAHFNDVWPYWMDQSQAVANSFDLDGLFLLTAPNMSGKSTLMRSTAAAALLTACGLCAPLGEGSSIPRFDTLFLRGASADVPAENKSAFGAEMGDIAALMRCCGSQSLIFVDELGRGTSPSDGTRLAGAVLEAMAKKGMRGIFATHLHDILELPLEGKERIVTKRMAVDTSVDNSYEWTYRLEDGVCRDSLALLTAARFGLPQDIITRAEELSAFLPQRISPDASSGLDGVELVDRSLRESVPTILPDNTIQNQRDDTGFRRAVSMLEKLTGERGVAIPPRWSPPASFEKKSCVYVLELPFNPPRYYVGETDSLSQRLRQHRRKGAPWAQARAVALPVSSKTQARAWESLCIQEMAQSGFILESTADGRSTRRFQTP